MSLLRLVGFGYRTPEAITRGRLAAPTETRDSLKYKIRNKQYNPEMRCPAKVSAGVHVQGAALPRPDFVDPATVILGIQKRFGHKGPDVDEDFFAKFRAFAIDYAKKHFQPVPADADLSVETWLDNSNYPGWRKDEIRAAHARVDEILNAKGGWEEILKVNSFIKDEDYLTWKHSRPINSRSDEYKCLSGPAFKAIEKIVFSDPSFIKKIPRDKWPEYIGSMLSQNGYVYASDYTSYEALFAEYLMEIELDLYDYMLQHHPQERDWVSEIGGTNHFGFKYVTGEIYRARMSGEMNTSLGNGYVTHIFHKFLIHHLYGKDCVILQEGDDTIYVSPGPISDEWYSKAGLEVKLESVVSLNRAQFCQLIFDDDDMVIVRDPVQYIVGFGWIKADHASTVKYDRLLLAARALSCIHQYPGHPVLQSFARWVHRTARVSVERIEAFVQRTRTIDQYEREKMEHFISISVGGQLPPQRPIGSGTRRLVEDMYGVSIEMQIRLESYFDGLNELGPIPNHLFGELLPHEWLTYWDEYVREVNVRDPLWRVQDCG